MTLDPKCLVDAVDELAEDLLEVSHEIHAHPELAYAEHRASQRLVDAARSHGLEMVHGTHGLETAFQGEFGKGGKHIDLIAEYDALPGIGHACGHNLIATAALGASLALFRHRDALPPGRIRFLGTPAEEKGAGKEVMALDGAFDHTDVAMMIHPAGVNLATMPTICMAEVVVTYHGRAAHAAAMPHRGLNALDGLLLAYQAISNLRQHIRSSERVHGIITEGGTAPNIVPERAAGDFYVRAADEEALAALKPRVEACFQAGATGSGTHVEIEWASADYLDLCTNWPLADRFQEHGEALGRDFLPREILDSAPAGSTDMGNVSHRVPSIHPMLACAPPNVSIHHPDFATHAGSESGDRAALDGAKALALTALDYLSDPALQEASRKAFVVAKGLSA